MSLREQLRVMVVDDMATSRGLIIQALDKIGIKRHDFAKNGETAMKSVSANPVHLVISDYNMPGMDGLALLKALREFKPTSRIGFIMVTGSEDAGVVAKGRALGMNNYLKKPFTPESLKRCIEAVVGKL